MSPRQRWLPERPHTRCGLALTIAAGILMVAAAGFALVYFVVFPTSSPAPFALTTTTLGAATATAGGESSTAGTASATGSGAQQATSITGAGGRWSVASGSQAGYRVREKLAFLPAESDAVGRTSSITGSATLTESKGRITIAAASFDVAVNTLKSDRSMRDEKIHEIGLESNRYPTATFVLSTPIVLPASARTGSVVHTSIAGVFDIHGVSRLQTLPAQLSLSGSTLQVVGSLTFPWSEFGMIAPSIGGFVNVTEHATMEFDLRLQHA
jgi:YceI-like domain